MIRFRLEYNLVSLFFFGGVSDRAGRRRIVLRAMGLAALSTCIYFFATNPSWLFVARVLSGFSIGLAAGAGTAWIAELDAEDRARATVVAVGINFAGLAVGPLISGFIAQYAARPLQLPFLIYIGLVALTAVFIARSLYGFYSLPVIGIAALTRAFDSLIADSAFAITLAVLALGALAMSLRMPALRIP